MKARRMGMMQVRALLDRAEARVRRSAIKNGWEVTRYSAKASRRSRYLWLDHPTRGRVKVRLGDHLPDHPSDNTIHGLVGVLRGVDGVCRWLRSKQCAQKPRRKPAGAGVASRPATEDDRGVSSWP